MWQSYEDLQVTGRIDIMRDRDYLVEQVLKQIKNGFDQPDEVTSERIVDEVVVPYVKDVLRANDMSVHPDNY